MNNAEALDYTIQLLVNKIDYTKLDLSMSLSYHEEVLNKLQDMFIDMNSTLAPHILIAIKELSKKRINKKTILVLQNLYTGTEGSFFSEKFLLKNLKKWSPEARHDLIKHLEKLEDVKKERATVKQDTFEDQLLKAVQANLGNRLPDDRMYVSSVTATVNSTRNHNKQLQPAFISSKLRGLGFRRGTKTNKGNTIDCPDDVFYQIADKNGIKIETYDK